MKDFILTALCFTTCFGKKNKVNIDKRYIRFEKYLKNDKINVRSIPKFIPEITQGVCVKVYDGDTITIAAFLPYKESKMYKFSVRLNGIDTPEIKGKCESENYMALQTRDIVKEKILNKIVTLENVKLEKYGRLLADVYIDNIHLNNWLVHNRYAVKYDGGTKQSPANWEHYYSTGKI